MKTVMRFLISTFAVFISQVTLGQAEEDRALRIAIESRPPTYGNPYTQALPSIFHTLFPVFDALTILGDNGEVLPNLSTSHERLDNLTWRFTLRSDVTFANGESFNAASFKRNLDYLLSEKGQTTYAASLIPTVNRVEIEDDFSLLVVTKTRDAILPRRMSTIIAVPAEAWDKLGPSEFGLKPIGSGPYQITDWGESDGILDYEAFPQSWHGAPGISEVDSYIQAEGVARSQALLSGQIDLAMNAAIDELDYLESLGMTVKSVITPVVGSLAFSNQDPDSPFSDVRVRQAFNYAIDREGIAKFIFGSLVEPTGQGTVPGVYGHNPDVTPYPHDPDRARALMAEAGHQGVLKLSARVSPGPPVMSILYQKVAQDLAAIGVQLDIQFAQGPSWVQMWFSGDWNGADLLSSAWSNTTFMDAARGFETYSCLRPNPFFCEPEIAKSIEAVASEFDADVRLAALKNISQQMHDLAPVVYLFPTTNNLVYTPEVTGLEFIGIRAKLESLRFADK
ncbi:MAG: ABC transporter substrate-binding protein [Rhodospirillaceae bacterium]|nr:ABC transporter substrate-binding protein [Rhodospirillaceae bacterium]